MYICSYSSSYTYSNIIQLIMSNEIILAFQFGQKLYYKTGRLKKFFYGFGWYSSEWLCISMTLACMWNWFSKETFERFRFNTIVVSRIFLLFLYLMGQKTCSKVTLPKNWPSNGVRKIELDRIICIIKA